MLTGNLQSRDLPWAALNTIYIQFNEGVTDPFATFLNDPSGNFIPFTAFGGSINVIGAAVPEPGSVALLVAAALVAAGGLGPRRRRQKKGTIRFEP